MGPSIVVDGEQAPRKIVDSPWILAPAAAIFAVVLGINLLVQGSGRAPVQLEE